MNKTTNLLIIASLLCSFSLLAGAVRAADAPSPAVQELFQKLMDATKANDYDAFVADGDSGFKAGITKQMFEGVSEQIAPRMKEGYQAIYWGQLSQRGYAVYVWKLEFEDRGDAFLARLSVKDGKVAGFLIN